MHKEATLETFVHMLILVLGLEHCTKIIAKGYQFNK